MDEGSPDGGVGVAGAAKALVQKSAQMLGVSRKKETASKGGYAKVGQGLPFTLHTCSCCAF